MKKMRLFVLLITLLGVFSSVANAQTITADDNTTNDEIGVVIVRESKSISKDVKTRGSYNTTSETCSGYFYLKSTNERLGDFECTGEFSYDGNLCNVTDVQTSSTNCANGYEIEINESTNQISPTYACATGNFSLYKLGLFGRRTLSSSAVINVYCNQNGNTSSEFNGG